MTLRERVRAVWHAVVHRGDILAGSCTVCEDLDGRPVVLDEMSVRNILVRIDPLCTLAEDAHVRVSARDVAAAIKSRSAPLHRRLPNVIAGAPRRDRAALARLHRLAALHAAASEDASLDLHVPRVVAAWIAIRYRVAERLLDEMAAQA